jgi:hypothetical protein
MIDKSNHTKVGKALYLKFTSETFREISGYTHKSNGEKIEVGDILNIQESSIPIHIMDKIQGDYECVCEFGTEIHEFGD